LKLVDLLLPSGMPGEKLRNAFKAFDDYNLRDPNTETSNGESFPKELLYAVRMTERLNAFEPHAPEQVQLAARCQHIGRWEIPRTKYQMNRKGYLQWRTELKHHHATIAERILRECGYDTTAIDRVKFLLLKKQLHASPETQLLEDTICLVFVEHYLDDFAVKHEAEKVVDILRKTMRKMSPRAIAEVSGLVKSERIRAILEKALAV
jgi:Domain of unknown function (DUF4202)